jgi:glycosyltransferase involved in cell wall biosynthesis
LKYVFANHRTWYKNPVGKLVYLASTLTDHIIVVSKSEWTLIESALGKKLSDRYVLVYNGIPSNQVVKPVMRPAKLRGKVIFCSTSRLVDAKGVRELITAFTRLAAELPNVHLWIAGDGPQAEEFKKLSTSSTIEFLGYLKNPLPCLAASDVFVHPSYHEAFSLSLVEATKLGLPIVACAVGGNPEIVDETNGILVAAKNSDALYAAMLKLAEDSDLRKMYGDASRKRFEQDFAFETIVENEVIPLYG